MGKEYAVKVMMSDELSLDVISFKNMPDEVRSEYQKTISENMIKGMEISEQAVPVADKSAERAYYQYIKKSINTIGEQLENDISAKRTMSSSTMQSAISLMAFIAAGEKVLKKPDEEARKAMVSGADKAIDYICSQAQKEMSSPELEKFASENILPDPEGIAGLLKDPVEYMYKSKLLSEELAAEHEKKAADPPKMYGMTEKPGTSKRDDGYYVIDWDLMTKSQKEMYSSSFDVAVTLGLMELSNSRISTFKSQDLVFEPVYKTLYKALKEAGENLKKSIDAGGPLTTDATNRVGKTIARLAATEYLVNHPTNEVEKLRDRALERGTFTKLWSLVNDTWKELDERTGFNAFFLDKVISDPEVIRNFLRNPTEFVYSNGLVPEGKPEKKREEKVNNDDNIIIIDTSVLDNTAGSSKKNQVTAETEIKPSYEKQIDINEWRTKINKCADKLERAKTFVNSSEYRNLITCMKSVGTDNFKSSSKLNGNEKFALEMFAIYRATDCYLKHKAKDGVKKNVYGKLAAVEEANRLVEECLQELGDVSFSTSMPDNGKELKSTREIPISFEAQKSLMQEKNPKAPRIRMYKEEDYSDIAERYVTSKPDMEDMKDTIKETVKNADACMCRIMMHAAGSNDMVSFNAIESRREGFLREPFPETKPEQVKQNANEGPGI